ncbi:MAG: iron-sulfur cluster insertion protein ErpA [Magnetospirillum sp. WYHS-4]
MTEASGIIRVSESAGRRIAELKEMEGKAGLMLRITVSGGGCAGFQYGFSLDENRNAEDVVFEDQGVGVVVDETSLGLLSGSELDFVEDLMGAYFTLKNPNATSTCGCGSSFSV